MLKKPSVQFRMKSIPHKKGLQSPNAEKGTRTAAWGGLCFVLSVLERGELNLINEIIL